MPGGNNTGVRDRLLRQWNQQREAVGPDTRIQQVKRARRGYDEARIQSTVIHTHARLADARLAGSPRNDALVLKSESSKVVAETR